jgi:hypothetical protein
LIKTIIAYHHQDWSTYFMITWNKRSWHMSWKSRVYIYVKSSYRNDKVKYLNYWIGLKCKPIKKVYYHINDKISKDKSNTLIKLLKTPFFLLSFLFILSFIWAIIFNLRGLISFFWIIYLIWRYTILFWLFDFRLKAKANRCQEWRLLSLK